MAVCRVSFTDSGIEHAVEVSADSLYEAAALAIAEFRKGWTRGRCNRAGNGVARSVLSDGTAIVLIDRAPA